MSVYRCTDLGNAERLIALHGSDLRYVSSWGRWLPWDGARWLPDEGSAVHRHAIATSKTMLDEAFAELDVANRLLAADPTSEAAIRAKKDAERVFKWCVETQNARRLEAMIAVARSDATVAVSHDRLDADPFALNVPNGTIDLETGKLRPHRRDDLNTKLAPVPYEAKATCPTWEAFLLRAMGGDAELVGYLQRVFGYALTGDIREHALGFFFGGGANGKSTALGTMRALLGDYGTTAPRGLLFRSRGERHPTELASLFGARFVVCAEVEAGASFDEALVKDLSGGDLISARRMREDFWSFAPTHKLFLAGNHKPVVKGDDEGIWRRLRLVPWTVTIPEAERDKSLPEKLRAELPGILAWCVRGCLAWQRDGLGDPPAVVAATKEYREQSDTLGEFLRSELTLDPEGRIARKDLRETYEAWCTESGYQPMGPRRIAERLRREGVREAQVRTSTGARDGWAGIRRATTEERLTRSWTGVVSSDLCGPDPGSSSRARAYEAPNRDPATTSHYSLRDDGTTFSEWYAAQGVAE